MRVIQIEEIEQLLLQVPHIVELQQSQPTAFVARAGMWMDLLEQALIAARAYQAARISALRSQLGFARSAVVRDPAESRTQPTRVRQLAFETANAMTEAAAIAAAVLDEQRPRLADAERRIHRLVAKLRSRNLLPASPLMSSTSQLAEARRAIYGHRDLEREFVAIEGVVGVDDAGVLLGRALTPQKSARIPDSGQEGANHTSHRR